MLPAGGEGDSCTCDDVYCPKRAVDVIVVLDESSSMRYDRIWVSYTIQQLDRELIWNREVGVDSNCPNRFALFAYGRNSTSCAFPLQKPGDPDVFLPADELLNSFSLTLPEDHGGCEDGHTALGHALRAARRTTSNRCVTTMLLLITDEDRDKNCGCNPQFTKKDVIRGYLRGQDVQVAVVVNQRVNAGDVQCLGMAMQNGVRNCYVPDRATYHDFTLVAGAALGDAYRRTARHYSNMAINLGGAVFDIMMARGDTNWHSSRAVRANFISNVPGMCTVIHRLKLAASLLCDCPSSKMLILNCL